MLYQAAAAKMAATPRINYYALSETASFPCYAVLAYLCPTMYEQLCPCFACFVRPWTGAMPMQRVHILLRCGSPLAYPRSKNLKRKTQKK